MNKLTCFTKILIAFLLCMHNVQAGEQFDRNAVYNAAQGAYTSGDYKTLERLVKTAQTNETRTASGIWHLSLLHYGIDRGIGTQKAFGYKAAKEEMQLWGFAFPHSTTQDIAFAQVFIKNSYRYPRQSKVNNLVPETGTKGYKEVNHAYEWLMKNKQNASKNPNFYIALSRVAKLNHMDKAQYTKLLNQGLAKHPYFYEIYFHAAQYFSPDYYGSKAELEKFVEDSVKRTKAVEGNSMYARIYWFLIQRDFGNKLFHYTNASWPKMKAGFDDLIKRYPAPWNINHYAKYACTLGKDKATTAMLFQLIEDQQITSREGWGSTSQFNHCKKFAIDAL